MLLKDEVDYEREFKQPIVLAPNLSPQLKHMSNTSQRLEKLMQPKKLKSFGKDDKGLKKKIGSNNSSLFAKLGKVLKSKEMISCT
jgi:hypothetical protein